MAIGCCTLSVTGTKNATNGLPRQPINRTMRRSVFDEKTLRIGMIRED